MTKLAEIPHDLRTRPQWIRWRYERRGADKPTKIPITCAGTAASTTDPSTWTTFGEVAESKLGAGPGFVFTADDPFVGIDLDNCIDENGKYTKWAKQLIARFNSYSEVSPSGRGVKIWILAKWPGPESESGKRVTFRDGVIEAYWCRRYFAVTGQVVGDMTTINDAQDALDGLYRTVLSPKTVARSKGSFADRNHVDRCMKMLERLPDAISGEDGHGKTLRAACECFRWGLNESEARALMEWWNANKCKPPWSASEIEHKIADGRKKVYDAGEFGKRLRQVVSPTIEYAEPPRAITALENRIGQIARGELENVPWPWPVLTKYTQAMIPGTITTVSGVGGSSKSLFVSQSCLHWLSAKIPFAVFHLEEDREFHLQRALAQLSGVSGMTEYEWVRANQEFVNESLEEHGETLRDLATSIWDAPDQQITLDDLSQWVSDRAAEGRRVIVVDPVTATVQPQRPWVDAPRFIERCKSAMRTHRASLIVVTHPRGANTNGSNLDNHAYGQAFSRFTQTVLFMQPREEKTLECFDPVSRMTVRLPANRRIEINKSRSAGGTGKRVAMMFDAKSLRFIEQGVEANE